MDDTTIPARQAATSPARANDLSTLALWAGGIFVLVLPIVLAFATGGYGLRRTAFALAAVLLVLAVVAVLAPWPLVPRGSPAVALAALAAFTAWSAISIAWARVLGDAAADAYRLLLYTAAFLLALCGLRLPELRQRVPDALLAGIVLVALYALAGRLIPAIVEVPEGARQDRLNEPFTYWNALGIFCVMGILLAVAAASDEERPPWLRALACAAAAPCGLALYLTYSRASWLALGAGLVVLLVIRRTRAVPLAAALSLSAIGVLIAAVQAFPAVLDAEGARTTQGLGFGAVMGVVCAAAALGHLRLAAAPAARRPLPIGPRLARAVAIVTIPAVIGIGLLVAMGGGDSESVGTGGGRVATLDTNRDALWGVALDAFAEHPLTGVGTSSFAVEWLRERDEVDRALDAHSLYVETLAELGIVGALLLAAFLAAVAAGIVAAVRPGPRDRVVAACTPAVVAFFVHAAFDWDWESPALAITALVLVAALLQRPDPRPRLDP
jgi:O-antigen ligase